VFVLSISAYYLLRNRYHDLAKRSFTVAASFGLASALSVVVLGDESGYTTSQNQKMKLAAIEAMWETEPAPAAFMVFGIPNLKTHENMYEIKVPWVLGIIATRSIDTPLPGIKDLVSQAHGRIKRGMIAYDALYKLRQSKGTPDPQILSQFNEYQNDLGYGLLLKRYTPQVTNATDEQIDKAAWDTVPNIIPIFWSFRFMVGIGFTLIALFATAFYLSSRRRIEQSRWFLRLAFLSLPLPWIAAELGWIVAEHGRQPWAIEGILPTYLGVSSVSTGQVWFSLIGFVVFYSLLAIIDVFLMIKYIKIGPAFETSIKESATNSMKKRKKKTP
jgi:cytochrome d ubiquinol oxidase subunit I